MGNIKKGFWKSVDFIYKHKVIAFLVAFTIATSFIIYGVLATDEYANDLKVDNISITRINDGGEANNELDNSESNGVVRNFDSITYEGKYSFDLKQHEDGVIVSDRTIVVDVIVPNTIKASLSSYYMAGDQSIDANQLSGSYNYYEFEIPGVKTSSEPLSFNFTLEGINASGAIQGFEPIVFMKEKTDSESYGEVSEGLINNTTSYGRVSCNGDQVAHCSTNIVGKYDYDIDINGGVYKNSEDTSTVKKMPIGVTVEMPENMIGVFIPNSVSIDFTSSYNTSELNVSYIEAEVYDDTKYTIYDGEGNPFTRIDNTINLDTSNNTLTISGLSYRGNRVVGNAVLIMRSERINQPTQDLDIEIGAVSEIENGEDVTTITVSATVTDYFKKFAGSYLSIINILSNNINSNDLGGKEVFLSNSQRFTIDTEFGYSLVGDSLDELTNYIKVDSDAFAIAKEGDEVTGADGTWIYGRGEWNLNYFEIPNNAPAGCPIPGDSLSKDQLMNLYGGPCIVAKNNVTWETEEENASSDKDIIIIKTVFGNVNPGTTAHIKINGVVKDQNNIINKSYKVTTMASGVFNDGETTQTIYMSEYRDSDEINSKDSNNYVKSVYDFANRTLINPDANSCGDEYCNINGKTIHIIGYIVNKPEVRTYYKDVERNSFVDYPIEWRITPGGINNDLVVLDGATVEVTIPNVLRYVDAEMNGEALAYSNRVVGTNSTKYIFTLTSEQIESGYPLSIFTDAYLNTKSSQVTVTAKNDYSGHIVNGETSIPLYDLRSDDYKTTEKTIQIYNDSYITTSGNVSPRYIEKNSPYNYNMNAYNNSYDEITQSGYSFSNATLYYMLPYNSDSNYNVYGKSFSNSNFEISLSQNLVAGYTAYYTTAESNNVLSDIYSEADLVTWNTWTNVTTPVRATAIKIVKNADWIINEYFYNQNGITARIKPLNNKEADAYYNGFIIKTDKPNGYDHSDDSDDFSNYLYYESSKLLAEVYSRKISGFIFEDYDYNDLYDSDETILEDITVELYKLNNSEYEHNDNNRKNPNAYISSNDEKIGTTYTSSAGTYEFTGLGEGNYYVIFNYDGSKYTPCARDVGDNNSINSNAIAVNNKDGQAVSNIISLTSETNSSVSYNNLGLKIKKDFAVEINKYITRVDITSKQGNKTYKYNKATKVNIDIKNMKNTHFKVTYSFDIVNTKAYPGYIGVIVDMLPAGMSFNPSLPENRDWVLIDGLLYYTGLQDKVLESGDNHYFNLVLDLDTNDGGTYLNIVAAQMPMLVGDDTEQYDYSDITIDIDDDDSGDGSNQNSTGNGE